MVFVVLRAEPGDIIRDTDRNELDTHAHFVEAEGTL